MHTCQRFYLRYQLSVYKPNFIKSSQFSRWPQENRHALTMDSCCLQGQNFVPSPGTQNWAWNYWDFPRPFVNFSTFLCAQVKTSIQLSLVVAVMKFPERSFIYIWQPRMSKNMSSRFFFHIWNKIQWPHFQICIFTYEVTIWTLRSILFEAKPKLSRLVYQPT